MTTTDSTERHLAAVDVGGTFTDLLVLGKNGMEALKVPSTPTGPEQGVMNALGAAGCSDASLVHGSTVATNAILERKGAITAFITTRGFADIIEIGRQNRPELYRLDVATPRPLVPRRYRFEAAERVGPGGSIEMELSREEAGRLAGLVRESGAQSAAVCLLFSFEAPEHELMIAEELSRLGIVVSLSSSVLPEYREFERASTTVVNAYVSPVMDGYLRRLESSLDRGDGGGRLRLMSSAGGTVSPEIARRRAADLVISGPAGGVVAAHWLGKRLGLDRIISFDMGGTSTDVSLIDGGLTVTRETRISGLPVALPMIDINTIGAGGGSLAGVDRAGVLRVGPQSAGADPGPACYGRGYEPTVTDANLLMGRLVPERFLGGRMGLEPQRSVEAFRALPGIRSVVEKARATIRVALSHMETAIKEVSIQKGHDPREFTLVAFGGAGPMHACELAENLDIPRVIVPVYPGLFSSLGMLLAEPGRDFTRTVLTALDEKSISALAATFRQLEENAAGEMEREGFADSLLHFERDLDMRYRGQSHQVTVPFELMEHQELVRSFERIYHSAFGYVRPGFDVEVVNAHLRCRAEREVTIPPPVTLPDAIARLGSVRVHFEKEEVSMTYDRDALYNGFTLEGPCLLLQDDTTTVVPPGWSGEVDKMGNLELWRK